MREALIELHRVLLSSEREQYEAVFGPITSTPHFLGLVLNDPWFSWLRPLSALVAEMDEALDEKELAVNTTILQHHFEKTRKLLQLNTSQESGFGLQYLEALQRDPDVILSHATVTRVMGSRSWPVK